MTRKNVPVDVRTVTSFDGTRLTYHVAGNPDGPPMVLANGLGGNIRAWRHLIDWFGPENRIVSWDYRGLYASEPAPSVDAYEVQDHVRDMAAVLDAECIEAPTVLGWSMGVQVAFEFHRMHPDRARAFVAINGTCGSPFRTAFRSDLLERFMPGVLDIVRRNWTLASGVAPHVAGSRAAVWALRQIGLLGHTADVELFMELASEYVRLDFGAYTEIFERLGNHDAWDVLESIRVPVLVIAGERDLFTPASVARRMADSLPDAELFVVPSATHYVPLEFPELLALRIEKFLRTHPH
ncbi:MAG: hypothetical protein AMXMBFR64_06370 [Myxococcales bacterium]